MPAQKKEHKPTTAFQVSNPEASEHVVGIGHLRVLVSQYDDDWIAQGLEIDYFAEGSSLDDVKASFQEGLAATIREHLKLYGTIQGILKTAPQDAWSEFFASSKCLVHSQITFHNTPFTGIAFYEKAA